MGARTDRWMSAALRTARQAKQWAIVAAREADRLLEEARARAESAERGHRLKRRLLKTGRVLRTAGKVALVASIAVGVAAARAERRERRERG